jgi:hypothetical protein
MIIIIILEVRKIFNLPKIKKILLTSNIKITIIYTVYNIKAKIIMTESAQKPRARRGRIFPDIQIPKEELARREAEAEAFSERCEIIFQKLLPELIEQYYGWYIAIEPDSGDYFIDKDKETASLKARQKHPNVIHHMFGINETGVSGTI